MKIIVDNKIPYLNDTLNKIADKVVVAPGKDFTPEMVHDADALMIRTRTVCNELLLKGSKVRFIATATIGFDHIDTNYCQKAGIIWKNAPGCNSNSVAQYLESTLLVLQQLDKINLSKSTIGIVGVGHVGSKVAEVARHWGMRVLLNDPPREKAEKSGCFCPLQQLAQECDLITFHTPLYIGGEKNTFHLANDTLFEQFRHAPILINTSRGSVVDTHALLRAMDKGLVRDAVIDVWEHEPTINSELLRRALIATPHIAGYSADGKANASRMSVHSLCEFFGLKADYDIQPPCPSETTICASSEAEALLKIYDPRRDSVALKEHPELFEHLRGNYPLRREKTAFTIQTAPYL